MLTYLLTGIAQALTPWRVSLARMNMYSMDTEIKINERAFGSKLP